MFFQTWMCYFLQLNTKENILKNVGNQTVAGSHWLPFYGYHPSLKYLLLWTTWGGVNDDKTLTLVNYITCTNGHQYYNIY